jgi:hypothetical protein
MPNSRDLTKYPVFLFEALRQTEHGDVHIQCKSKGAAQNLRSQMYTLRRLLQLSPEPQWQELAAVVEKKKFYVDADTVIIADPMLGLKSSIVSLS